MFILISIIDEGKNLKYFKYILLIYPVFIIFSLYSYIDGRKNWEKIFNNNDYEIVEGYVENFLPELTSGTKRPESFTINGIKFSYSRSHFNGYYNSSNSKINEGLYLKLYHRDGGIISIWIYE